MPDFTEKKKGWQYIQICRKRKAWQYARLYRKEEGMAMNPSLQKIGRDGNVVVVVFIFKHKIQNNNA